MVYIKNTEGATISPTSTETDISDSSLYDDTASSTTGSSSTSSLQYSVSREEASFYYSGLPSSPMLVYRTGATPWTRPIGPEAYPVLKELCPVFGHKLNNIWKDLGPRIHNYLDSVRILWTSIDVVRFKRVGEGEVVGPVILWIGVAPGTLSGLDAHTAANGCLAILKTSGVIDVEIEYRESTYTRLVGPTLLKPVLEEHPTADFCGPLTPSLGLFIAAQATPHIGGTGGLYLAEGGHGKKVFLLTARHVLFPPNKGPNVDYARENTSIPSQDVILLGTKAFDDLIKSIERRIKKYAGEVERCNRRIERLKEREAGEDEDEDEDDAEEARRGRMRIQTALDGAKETVEALGKFHGEVTKKWGPMSERIIGHIARSPPITFGAGMEGFTEDYAIVELDSSKIEKAFMGNVIDLGTKIQPDEFEEKMNPRVDANTRFKYPDERLLRLQGVLQESDIRNPEMMVNGDICFLVIKNGLGTGVTIGRATGIYSFIREYFDNGTVHTSMEWAVLPYDHNSGPFSAPGDSGSIIVDGRGRIGGLLTGGAGKPTDGKTEVVDITYATPFFWLLPRIKGGFPNVHILP